MSDKINFKIPGKPAYITMVRLAIGSIADTAGFDMDEIDDIKTAVGEACKEIACHGKEGTSSEYTVECVLEEGHLDIFVTDTTNRETLKDVSMKCRDCPNEGDLGMFMIRSIMNEVQVFTGPEGNKTIKMVKRK